MSWWKQEDAPPQESTVLAEPATPQTCGQDYAQGGTTRQQADTVARRQYGGAE